MEPFSAELEHGRQLLARAPRVIVLTGAGISAESGVPTFRDADGLWQQHRAEDLATPEAFARDPRLVWEWYAWRRDKVAACQPNAAHRALVRFALRHVNALIVTQNVDGLHGQAAREEAGDDDPGPALPIELHGNLFKLRCTRCERVWESRAPIDASSESSLPRCDDCQALARPHIVWFGENLDQRKLSRAFVQAELAAVCLVIGTAGVVQPAASIALLCAQSGGAVIEVNPNDTELSELCTVTLRGTAATVVPALLAAVPPDSPA